jgi:hypothetical protein
MSPSAPSADPTARLARQIALAALVVANIAVAVLAFRDDHGYQFLLFVYGAETIVIAVLNLPKMLIVATTRPRPQVGAKQALSGIVGVLIGLWIYAVALGFLLMLAFVGAGMLGWAFDFDARSGRALQLPEGEGLSTATAAWAVGLLAMSHLVSFVANFLVRGEFRSASLVLLLVQPFLRTGLLIALVIIGAILGAAKPAIAAATLFTALLVVVKIASDVIAHQAERARLQPNVARSGRVRRPR